LNGQRGSATIANDDNDGRTTADKIGGKCRQPIELTPHNGARP
jgi:hypothetical protein